VAFSGSGRADDNRLYTDPDYASSDMVLVTNDDVQIHLDENEATYDETGVFRIYNGGNVTVFRVDETGAVTSAGPASTSVQAGACGSRKVYAMQSAGSWLEDFGAAQLAKGQATVEVEPVFAQTVSLAAGYHVFLTPLGDCPLYVSEETAKGFTVRAMGGEAYDVGFDYRIVARQLGSEDPRLEAVALDGAEGKDG